MPASKYARSLKGLTIICSCRTWRRRSGFSARAGVEVIYSDPDFAVLRGYGGEWMLHADHTYEGHALKSALRDATQRGAGAELRLHGCDPDKSEAAARQLDSRFWPGRQINPRIARGLSRGCRWLCMVPDVATHCPAPASGGVA